MASRYGPWRETVGVWRVLEVLLGAATMCGFFAIGAAAFFAAFADDGSGWPFRLAYLGGYFVCAGIIALGLGTIGTREPKEHQ